MSIIPKKGVLSVLDSRNYVSKEVHKQRFDICQKCENKTKIGTCGLCGCFVVLKTRIIEESCDANYW